MIVTDPVITPVITRDDVWRPRGNVTRHQRSDGIEEMMMGNVGNEKKELYFSSVKAEMEQSG